MPQERPVRLARLGLRDLRAVPEARGDLAAVPVVEAVQLLVVLARWLKAAGIMTADPAVSSLRVRGVSTREMGRPQVGQALQNTDTLQDTKARPNMSIPRRVTPSTTASSARWPSRL